LEAEKSTVGVKKIFLFHILVEKIETKLVQMMFLLAASSAKPMTIFLKAGEASALARSSASMADTILGK
jgi:hypothetical protein